MWNEFDVVSSFVHLLASVILQTVHLGTGQVIVNYVPCERSVVQAEFQGWSEDGAPVFDTDVRVGPGISKLTVDLPHGAYRLEVGSGLSCSGIADVFVQSGEATEVLMYGTAGRGFTDFPVPIVYGAIPSFVHNVEVGVIASDGKLHFSRSTIVRNGHYFAVAPLEGRAFVRVYDENRSSYRNFDVGNLALSSQARFDITAQMIISRPQPPTTVIDIPQPRPSDP